MVAKYVIPLSSEAVNKVVVPVVIIKGPMAESAQVNPLLKSL